MLTIRRISKKPLRFTVEEEPRLGDWYYAGSVKTSSGEFKPRLRWGIRVPKQPVSYCASCRFQKSKMISNGLWTTSCMMKQPGYHPSSNFATYCPEYMKND